jgi:hypothetical protein
LFNRGIDPDSIDAARTHRRSDWPSRLDVRAFAETCDERVFAALTDARLDDSANPQLEPGPAAYTILEHEEMHHETLLYIVHRLPTERKRVAQSDHRDTPVPQTRSGRDSGRSRDAGCAPRQDPVWLG